MSAGPGIVERLKGAPIVRQFVKYAVVGVINVTVFLAIFNVLLTLGVMRQASQATAFLVTSVNGYLLNKRWTFRDPRVEGRMRQYLVFVGFTVMGLAMNLAITQVLHGPLERNYGRIGTNLAALAPLPISVLWNFTAYRRWTFQHGPAPAAS